MKNWKPGQHHDSISLHTKSHYIYIIVFTQQYTNWYKLVNIVNGKELWNKIWGKASDKRPLSNNVQEIENIIVAFRITLHAHRMHQ